MFSEMFVGKNEVIWLFSQGLNMQLPIPACSVSAACRAVLPSLALWEKWAEMDSELRAGSVLGFQRGRELKLDLGFRELGCLFLVGCLLLGLLFREGDPALSRGCNHALWFRVRAGLSQPAEHKVGLGNGDAGASLVRMVTAGS